MEGPDDVIFDTTIRDDSLVTQYGFTCDAHAITQVHVLRSLLIYMKIRVYMFVTIKIHEGTCSKIYFQIYAAIIFIGVLCGSLLFGYLSDRFGRKLALILAILTVTISPTLGALMPTAAGFGFFRFLMGKFIGIQAIDSIIISYS